MWKDLAPDRQEEFELEFQVQSKQWPNGKISSRLLAAAPVRGWKVTWDGLTMAEAFRLEQHYYSCAGPHMPFEYVDIHQNYLYIVKYQSTYKRTTVRPGVQLYKISHSLIEYR